MHKQTISIAALCDKAGRKINQDNIFLSCRESIYSEQADGYTIYSCDKADIPPEGTVLVVADGMGGMNAGEVASQIVVETIGREVEVLAGQCVSDTRMATEIAHRAVVNADNAIKQYVAAHPETAGTGSTVVLLWLLGNTYQSSGQLIQGSGIVKAVVAWCGDSRCYRFNQRRGLEQLSHDHSYVQQMVDKGQLPPEQAFGHENSNIITRCLSDDREVAEPDVKVIDVYCGDVFLLCSDGLCGLLPDEVTEQLVKDADNDVRKALDNCWQQGMAKGWSDNVSIIMASIDGVETEAPVRHVEPSPEAPSYSSTVTSVDAIPLVETKPKARRHWPFVVAVAVLLMVVCAVLLFSRKHSAKQEYSSSDATVRKVSQTVDSKIPNPIAVKQKDEEEPPAMTSQDSSAIQTEETSDLPEDKNRDPRIIASKTEEY